MEVSRLQVAVGKPFVQERQRAHGGDDRWWRPAVECRAYIVVAP